jgi:hypothetical protein
LVHSTLPVVLLNFPATHATHGPPLGPVNPVLHVQFVDTVQPLHEAPELAGHAPHVVVRPVVFEKVPVVQAVHAALPVVVLKVPATQGAHGPPLGPVYPTLQVQEVTAGLEIGEFIFTGQSKQNVRFDAPSVVEYFPTGHAKQVVAIVAPVVVKYVPAAQLVHATLPVVGLKVPGIQATHGPPPGPVYPTLQMQEVTAGLERGELEFAGHSKQSLRFDAPNLAEYVLTGQAQQTDDIVAFTAVEYVPAEQLVHATLPVVVLKVPGIQATHGPPLGPVYPTLQVQLVGTKQLPVHVDPEFAGHTVQGPPTGPLNPNPQVQPSNELHPLQYEPVFAGQAVQVSMLVACTVDEYVLTPQIEQGEFSTVGLNLPAVHDTHSLPPSPPKPALHRQSEFSCAIFEPLPMACTSTDMSASDNTLGIR